MSEPRTWFVAAEIEGNGTGLWVTNIPPDSGGSGLIFGVNDDAQEHSILGVDAPPQATEADLGAQEAIDCLGAS